MNLEPPAMLIDIADGSVHLRLVPFHLERLHGPYPEDAIRERDDARRADLPFPFLPAAQAIDVVLRSGMTPVEIGDAGGFEPNSSVFSTSWWRWASYALTPFGWVPWPAPFFRSSLARPGRRAPERLTALTLSKSGLDAQANFMVMDEWLERELGSAYESTDAPPYRRWQFAWGEVALYHEPRDGAAELGVSWIAAE